SAIHRPAELAGGDTLTIPIAYASTGGFPSRLHVAIDSNDAAQPHLFLTYFGLLCPTPTVTETEPSASPTPTPTLCPYPTAEPFSVDPVTSPTNALSQIVSVRICKGDRVEIVSEAGRFVATGEFGYADPALVRVTLVPNTVNHLRVLAHVRRTDIGDCIYGDYTLIRDVVIVQATTTGIARAPAFLVKDINATFVPRSSSPGGFVTVGGTTFVSASTPETGFELWKLDGLETGPVMVKDINPGPGDSAPSGFTILDDRLFFVADSGAGLPEIWNSDGTSAGTRRVTSF